MLLLFCYTIFYDAIYKNLEYIFCVVQILYWTDFLKSVLLDSFFTLSFF